MLLLMAMWTGILSEAESEAWPSGGREAYVSAASLSEAESEAWLIRLLLHEAGALLLVGGLGFSLLMQVLLNVEVPGAAASVRGD